MSRTRKSLVLNLLAGGWSKASGTVIRLLQVPVLISALGVDDYGRWLLLSSIPAWLSLANFGFGSVASNQMSMAVASGDLARARVVFTTTLLCIAGLGLALAPPLIIAAQYVPWDRVLGVPAARVQECAFAAACLVVSIFIAFGDEVLGGRLRAARKTHLAMLMSSARPWIELAAILVAVMFAKSFSAVALATLATTVLFSAAFAFASARLMPAIRARRSDFHRAQVREIFAHGIAFQAFPLGNALTFQGTLFVLQAVLGPAAVVTFATARTVVRTVSQLVEILNQSIWSEFSHLMGAGDFTRAARLHRLAVAAAFGAATCGAVALVAAGPLLYHLWLGKSLTVPRELFAVFVLALPLNAVWTTSSTVHMASNRHRGLALRYLGAASVSLAACAMLAHFFGLAGAALAVCVGDALLLPYVLITSMALTHDAPSQFLSRLAADLRPLLQVPGWRAAAWRKPK